MIKHSGTRRLKVVSNVKEQKHKSGDTIGIIECHPFWGGSNLMLKCMVILVDFSLKSASLGLVIM